MLLDALEYVASKPILKLLKLLIQEFMEKDQEIEHTLSDLATLLNYSPEWLYQALDSIGNDLVEGQSFPFFRITGKKRGFKVSLNRDDEFVRCLIFFERLKDMGIPAGDIIK
ncbi:MAG: hypothetical protein ACTSXU_11585 [Promethearchaeota archaeon]